MDSEKFVEEVQQAVRDMGRTITRYSEAISAMGEARDLGLSIVALPSAVDIDHTSFTASYDGEHVVRLYLTLLKDRHDSPILREMVKAGIVSRIAKTKSWDEKSLNASFSVGRVEVTITGYVPNSCHMVEEDVDVVVDDARIEVDPETQEQRIVRTVRTQKIVCTEDAE